jgi:hypothetical protein
MKAEMEIRHGNEKEMNEETKPIVFPEQENPPRPTYEANIRGIAIGGWLYYGTSAVTVIVTVDNQRTIAQEFMIDEDCPSARARGKAKNVWRNVVVAVLAGV